MYNKDYPVVFFYMLINVASVKMEDIDTHRFYMGHLATFLNRNGLFLRPQLKYTKNRISDIWPIK